jgi:hypothetical protein
MLSPPRACRFLDGAALPPPRAPRPMGFPAPARPPCPNPKNAEDERKVDLDTGGEVGRSSSTGLKAPHKAMMPQRHAATSTFPMLPVRIPVASKHHSSPSGPCVTEFSQRRARPMRQDFPAGSPAASSLRNSAIEQGVCGPLTVHEGQDPDLCPPAPWPHSVHRSWRLSEALSAFVVVSAQERRIQLLRHLSCSTADLQAGLSATRERPAPASEAG